MPQHIIIDQDVPALAPQYIGQEYFDQNTQKFYKAAGTNSTDWQLLGAGSGGGGANVSIFSGPWINGSIEGPGAYDITADILIYSIGFGGPGLKTVNLPAGLELDKRHSFVIFGRNTYGSAITVQIGTGSNVKWSGGTAPTFPTGNVKVEMLLFTLDGGTQWYGRVLGSY